MPQYDGPLKILSIDESESTVTLDLPPDFKILCVFHTSKILPYKENDPVLFPT